MKKTKKQRALKQNTKGQSGFFKALVMGFLSCAVTWIVLALVFAVVMSNLSDQSAAGKYLSPIIVVFSLLTGGYTAAKADKSCAVISSFVMGTAVLGICYLLSSALDLSRQLGDAVKTVVIAVMLVCPLIGAKIAAGKKRVRVRHGRKM